MLVRNCSCNSTKYKVNGPITDLYLADGTYHILTSTKVYTKNLFKAARELHEGKTHLLTIGAERATARRFKWYTRDAADAVSVTTKMQSDDEHVIDRKGTQPANNNRGYGITRQERK